MVVMNAGVVFSNIVWLLCMLVWFFHMVVWLLCMLVSFFHMVVLLLCILVWLLRHGCVIVKREKI